MISSFWTGKPRKEVFDLVFSADAMEQFQGRWPIPGIESVLPGGEILVRDSWGFYNREKVVQLQSPEIIVFRITPNPLLQVFARSLEETWRFQEDHGGTRVWREFQWDQRLPFPEKTFRRAIEKNNKDLARFIAHTEKPQRPLNRYTSLF